MNRRYTDRCNVPILMILDSTVPLSYSRRSYMLHSRTRRLMTSNNSSSPRRDCSVNKMCHNGTHRYILYRYNLLKNIVDLDYNHD